MASKKALVNSLFFSPFPLQSPILPFPPPLSPQTTLASAWSSTLSYYSTYTARQLIPLVQRMAAAVVKALDTKAPFKAVTLKYKAKKYLGVSDFPELRGEVMEKLARKEAGM